jgi:SOS-response transcriptional repressor LexA
MTSPDDFAIDELMRLVGAELERMDDELRFRDERMLAWIAQDLRDAMSTIERERDERDAEAFARSVLTKRIIRRADAALPRSAIRRRRAEFVGPAAVTLPLAADAGCAVLLGLSAAAGAGLELWDEPSDTWVELPNGQPPGRYIALGVAGDSMTPVLQPRDVILVQLDVPPSVDDLVVARLGDEGYVVKRVAAVRGARLELASFNPAYPPIQVMREQGVLLGKVVARFSRE